MGAERASERENQEKSEAEGLFQLRDLLHSPIASLSSHLWHIYSWIYFWVYLLGLPRPEVMKFSFLQLFMVNCFVLSQTSSTAPAGGLRHCSRPQQQSVIDPRVEECGYTTSSSISSDDDVSILLKVERIERDLAAQEHKGHTEEFLTSYRFLASSMFLSLSIMLKRHSAI